MMAGRCHQWFWRLTVDLLPTVKLSPGAPDRIVGQRGDPFQWPGSGHDPQRFGVLPHQFRDAAATTLARISSESGGLIRPVLAHSGFQTGERYYIHAQTIEAGLDYAAVVQRLKKGRS